MEGPAVWDIFIGVWVVGEGHRPGGEMGTRFKEEDGGVKCLWITNES